jgi:hypothetical protein
MLRLYAVMASLLPLVGLGLLACSVLLVPNQLLFASGPDGPGDNCPSNLGCDSGCKSLGSVCVMGGCTNVPGCTCERTAACKALCMCNQIFNECECGNK